jgi:integrase
MINSITLADAIRIYLDDLAVNRRDTTVNRAEQILREFQATVGNPFLADITREHINSFILARRTDAANSNRTLWNKSTRVLALLNHHGIDPKTLRFKKPRYIESLPEVYSAEDLHHFFAACNQRQLCYFKTLLMTGLRMQESRYLEWGDISSGTLHIRAHPPLFTPKTNEERCIPLPKALQQLIERLPHRPGKLVFPTKWGSPDKKQLQCCKRTAQRAGLNPAKWSLHGFRRTFCTSLLRAGLDARSVMSLMGHTDIESTLRYWRPLEAENLRSRVDQVFSD